MKTILFSKASIYTEMVIIRQNLSRAVDDAVYDELARKLLNTLQWEIKMPLDIHLKYEMH